MPTERKTFNDITRVLNEQVNRSMQTLERLEEMATGDKTGVLAKALKDARAIAGDQSAGEHDCIRSVPPANDVDGNDWVNYTPELPVEIQEAIAKNPQFRAYCLTMNSPLNADDLTACSEEQEILLTREEFIGQKHYLAAVRGLTSAKPNDCRIGVAQARRMLVNVNDAEAQILAAALEDMRNENGTLTPSERLIDSLLQRNAFSPIDEDTVDHVVREFKLDVKDLRQILTEYSLKHPWLLEKPAEV